MKCKMVFMLLWGMLLSSLSMGAQQVTNKLYIPEVECGRGKTINVAVAIMTAKLLLYSLSYGVLIIVRWSVILGN